MGGLTFKLGDVAGGLSPRPCWRKKSYDSRGGAEAQLRSILKRGLERDAARINTYACPHCGKWHVGHSREAVR